MCGFNDTGGGAYVHAHVHTCVVGLVRSGHGASLEISCPWRWKCGLFRFASALAGLSAEIEATCFQREPRCLDRLFSTENPTQRQSNRIDSWHVLCGEKKEKKKGKKKKAHVEYCRVSNWAGLAIGQTKCAYFFE